MFEKWLAVILSACLFPQPIEKGEKPLKVPFVKGDLGGAKCFATNQRTFKTTS
ncbi:hypothetical protein NIES37_22200 [Tolypothrix tenuis PCC 7101]|uniref:Uncharacterized protein n=1 Tax=Tolypothrix tenuis PCC 7101 TaxID=231146 RepID=A0A1Z4MXU7_9CYAN|nr:hypothetical protein NIES37_22200 [Tolypothrix tenuis PCC 7101]BAZ77809.1 hypothetical protein NIES50_64420 [Aulosira laxa NIES-50]